MDRHGWSDHIFTWDHHITAHPCVMEVPLREDSESNEKDDKHAFAAVDPMVATVLTPRLEENEPRTILCKLRWLNKVLEFWQTVNNAIRLCDSIPACLVKVVKRNLDDTEVEVLYEKEQLAHREVHRVILKENSAAKRRRRFYTLIEISMRLKPVIAQRYDGVSKAPMNKTKITMHLCLNW